MKKLRQFICLLGSAASLIACSPVKLLNFTITKTGYSVTHDVAYGPDPRQKLDVYTPDHITAPVPVVVFFYGGSWQFGSKNDYLFAGQALASRGFVVVMPDYRLYPQVHFPAFIDDGAQAFRWAHEHAGEYGGDADKMFLAGHSAGAYIAVMLTVNPVYFDKAGVSPEWLKGTLGAAGPYNFLPFTDPKIKALFSTAPDAETQPINFVHAGLPPMLLATGDADDTVSPKNSLQLAEKLRGFGDPVEVKIYPGVAHVGIALSLAERFRYKSPLLEDMTRFITDHAASMGAQYTIK